MRLSWLYGYYHPFALQLSISFGIMNEYKCQEELTYDTMCNHRNQFCGRLVYEGAPGV